MNMPLPPQNHTEKLGQRLTALIAFILVIFVLPMQANADGIKTGIGTSAVPVGGYGGGMVAIHGADDDAVDGPGIQFTTVADDYPVFAIQPFYHGSVAIRFNCFFDDTKSGAARHRSSSADSATILSQFDDKFLVFRGNPASGANSQLNRVISMQVDLTDGKVKFPEVYNQTTMNTQKQLYVDEYGTLCVQSSSERYKENIRDFTSEENAWIYALRPRQFNFKASNSSAKEIGLIAEEVAEVQPDLVIFANAPQAKSAPKPADAADPAQAPAKARIPESVHYDKLIVPLLAEVQDLRKVVQELQAQIAVLEAAK